MTTNSPYQLAVVISSVREGRFAPVVANWFLDRAKQRDDVTLSVIDLAESPGDLSPGVAAADAVVVIVPEYNHSYPGPLKSALDATGPEWHGKPVAFVSYGGSRAACARWNICARSSPNSTPPRSARP